MKLYPVLTKFIVENVQNYQRFTCFESEKFQLIFFA